MKQANKYIITIAALLLSVATWAQGKFDYIYQLNGASSTAEAAGTINGEISENGTATLTLTPTQGNYINAAYITVVKTLNGSNAQTRVSTAENVNITANNANADPSAPTTYTFAVEDANYDYEVTANFQSRTSISSATVILATTSYTYDGQEHKPVVNSVKLGETTLDTNDYTVSYADDCTNVGTVTVTTAGIRTYIGTATATYSITEATLTVTATDYNGTYDAKSHGISVTAPEGATVMYGTKKGTYELTASPTYTNAGTYKVHYQVTQDNFTTITDSAIVKISKAASGLTYSATTASAELRGSTWTAPSLSNPHGLDITYSSSNTDVATISTTGVVTLTGIGQTTIKATTAGNQNYTASEAQYELTVSRGKAKSYGVKIGDTEVDEDNYSDIFGDNGTDNGDYKRVAPSMLFNPEDNTLLIIGSNEGLTIESTLPELKIHLSNDNKLKKVVFNNQGNSANTGKLLFTCDSNFPGKLTIENTEGESAISGFANISYEFGLQPLSPEDAKYQNGKMVDGNGAAASTVVIGTVLNPLTGDEPENLNPDDFTVTYPDGTTATVDLTNNTINNILYTLNNETEGQGYDPDFNDIGIVTTMTDETVNQIADDVANNTLIVGSDDYANRFIGLTFIVQGGEGIIKIDQEVVEGYEFHLKMGDKAAIKIADYITPQLYAEVPYQFDDATFCWLYLVKKPGASSRRSNTRVNKRDKLMGTIKQVKVKAKSMASTNSAAKASGGKITPTVNSAITGIEEIQVDSQTSNHMKNDKWYTLDGRQIDKPSQKGIYIKNEKKVVIK